LIDRYLFSIDSSGPARLYHRPPDSILITEVQLLLRVSRYPHSRERQPME